MDSIGLIREFLKDRLGVEPDTVVPQAPLADLGVDSLMMLELMFEFEDRFDIKLSNVINTVGRQLKADQCYDTTDRLFCGDVIRGVNPNTPGNWALISVNDQNINVASYRVKGYDLVTSYGFDVNSLFKSAADRGRHGAVDDDGIRLDDEDRSVLHGLPVVEEDSDQDVSEVTIALEAKACMTEHLKSIPRLHAEILATGYLAKRAAPRCISVSYSLVNAADTFCSPGRAAKINQHRQPEDARRVVQMLGLGERAVEIEEQARARGRPARGH